MLYTNICVLFFWLISKYCRLYGNSLNTIWYGDINGKRRKIKHLTYTTLSKFYRNRNSSSNVICHRVQLIYTILAFKFFIISNHKNSIVFRTNIFNVKWNVQISFTLYNLILASVRLRLFHASHPIAFYDEPRTIYLMYCICSDSEIKWYIFYRINHNWFLTFTWIKQPREMKNASPCHLWTNMCTCRSSCYID